ncbi:hypothetical protein [Caballeronia sp. INDeC2]|uniref:hypothetical protein n=1 Tax=Caballeronia sp. INDeC2 TaxID=2921747 RepID=UPI002027E734|nr:hypothetical protein [Caballeronia sp. INDeC2]
MNTHPGSDGAVSLKPGRATTRSTNSNVRTDIDRSTQRRSFCSASGIVLDALSAKPMEVPDMTIFIRKQRSKAGSRNDAKEI